MDNNAVLLLVLQFCRAQPGGSESAGGGWSCQLSPQKCICLLGQMLRCKVLQPGDRCPALSGCRLSRPKRLPAHPETWTEADVRRQSTQVAARYQVTSDRPIRCLETLGRPMRGPGLRAERPDVKPRGRRSRTVSPVVPQQWPRRRGCPSRFLRCLECLSSQVVHCETGMLHVQESL